MNANLKGNFNTIFILEKQHTNLVEIMFNMNKCLVMGKFGTTHYIKMSSDPVDAITVVNYEVQNLHDIHSVEIS